MKSYNYLVDMNLGAHKNLTPLRDELMEQRDMVLTQLNEAKSIRPEDMWKKDLRSLISKLNEVRFSTCNILASVDIFLIYSRLSQTCLRF